MTALTTKAALLLGLSGIPLAGAASPGTAQMTPSGWPDKKIIEDYGYDPVQYWFELNLDIELDSDRAFPDQLRELLRTGKLEDAMTALSRHWRLASGVPTAKLKNLLSKLYQVGSVCFTAKRFGTGGRPDLRVILDSRQGTNAANYFGLHMGIQLPDKAFADELNKLLVSNLPEAMKQLGERGTFDTNVCPDKLKALLLAVY